MSEKSAISQGQAFSSEEQWLRVEDPGEVTRLAVLSKAFHDAISVSAEWRGGDEIDDQGNLIFGTEGSQLLLRLESQFKSVPAIELWMKGVTRFVYDGRLDFDFTLDFLPDGLRLNVLAWTIECSTLWYRPLPGSSEQV